MTVESSHDFFLAGAGVAGALIGLLFVAISVSGDRLAKDAAAQVNRIRAQAALTTFINSLVVSLFALISPALLGRAAITTAIIGLATVASSLLSLVRQLLTRQQRPWTHLRDGAFLLALVAVLVYELAAGWSITTRPSDVKDIQTIAVLVVLSFVIGIARSWELIGAPATTGVGHETALLLRQTARQLKKTDHPSGRRPLPRPVPQSETKEKQT